MVDGGLIIGFFLIFNWFLWKLGFWCIPSSVFCVVQPCRLLFLLRKTALLRQNMISKHQGSVFSGEKKPPPGLHHAEVRIGDAATNCFYQNPDIWIQISRYPDFQISISWPIFPGLPIRRGGCRVTVLMRRCHVFESKVSGIILDQALRKEMKASERIHARMCKEPANSWEQGPG